MELEKIEKALIDSAIRVVKDGEGCLYIIVTYGLNHEPLIKNDIEKFSISEPFYQKRMDILAKTDGACLVDIDGNLYAYGQKINQTKSFDGFGTRHSAAYTASLCGNIAILGSQENKKVKIFKEGKILMQIDPLEKDVEKNTAKAASLLESIGVGSIASISTGMIFPITGLAIIPGILMFGSSHYIIKMLMDKQDNKS